MKKPYLEAGKVVGTHGVRGEFKIQPWCDSAAFLCGFHTLYLDDAGQKPLNMQSLRPHKNVVLAKADGVTSMEQAEALRGKILYISRADAHLDEGNWFVQDLLSCKVVDVDTGEEYGTLTEVIPGVGAFDAPNVICADTRNHLGEGAVFFACVNVNNFTGKKVLDKPFAHFQVRVRTGNI